ncbi:thiamine pyrophosphate-dependent enzyme [Amycolatopsis sp. MtRt-6]|uniref:thiamine pyrophosphate-dependent enzyme n=1 Tax=Amycolatopsis sp. MtRt-6 TaxID=2792782 RepID=UPI001A907D0E|nr:thiamine pyrophosphate-dependent enzyme [Amycolatopsis sp. MtRt-6]
MSENKLSAAEFAAAMRDYGVRRVTGVPCGQLAGPWALFDGLGRLTPAVNEGAALALAAGWELGGTPAAVLCQNSGLGNLVNPLASLLLPCRIPVFVAMTLRGWPDPASDEPQHAAMGGGSLPILDALGVPHAVVRREPDGLAELFEQARRARRAGLPFFALVPRGTFAAAGRVPSAERPDDALTRPLVVAALMAELGDELLVTTTGYLSRQANHERDRARTFYMQGSMGHAAAIGLGLAIAHPHLRTVVLDGDGALLMHLGTGATVPAAGARNLVHVVVDNGCYESTGCQGSISSTVDWTALGAGLGYDSVITCGTREDLTKTMRWALRAPGPVLCVLDVVPTPEEVHPRASASAGLAELTDRFRTAVAAGARR